MGGSWRQRRDGARAGMQRGRRRRERSPRRFSNTDCRRPSEKSCSAATLTPRASANVKRSCEHSVQISGRKVLRPPSAPAPSSAANSLGRHFPRRGRSAGARPGRRELGGAGGPWPCLMEQKTHQHKPGRCGGRGGADCGRRLRVAYTSLELLGLSAAGAGDSKDPK